MKFRCLVHFAQAHSDFRLPELRSVAELYGVSISKPNGDDSDAEEEEWDPRRPFWVVDFEEEEHALKFAQRCILVKSMYEFYARGESYEEVYDRTKSRSHLWERYIADTSFRFTVSAYNHTMSLSRQREIVESFRFMDFQGPIDLKSPQLHLTVFEEYNNDESLGATNKPFLQQIFFGKLIAQGSARALMHKFDVKKRTYFGNTSMESEMSLLMANQTLASPGKFVYDPFIGTGSMAYTVAEFGSFVFGSDIDGRQMRGKVEECPGIRIAAKQYGVDSRIIDLCTFDVTKNPFRCGGLFDAIVTDPPYGVRAGAKRLGRKNTDRRISKRNPEQEQAQARALMQYVPPTKPYELSDLVRDLVLFARHILKPRGRLVFFLPTVTDEYEEVDINTMKCEGMELVSNSLQNFGSWGRRLITLRKTSNNSYPSPFDDDVSPRKSDGQTSEHVPAHKDFREKYFRGFKKDEEKWN